MLKECRTHGYFRSEDCPICGEQGRFLMNEEELDKIGRTMAGVLRHFPDRYGLKMDGHGWIDLGEFINSIQVRQRRFRWIKAHHILAIIDTDPKGRYQFRDGMLRATYAHSIDVDIDLPTRNIPELLFYPTTKEEKDIVLETGLLPSDRKKVHLSRTVESAIVAGKVRDPNPLIFEVNSVGVIEDGHVISKAGNTVFVVDAVPGKFLRLMDASELPPPEESEVLPEEESEVLPEEESEVLPEEESEELPPEETEKLPPKK